MSQLGNLRRQISRKMSMTMVGTVVMPLRLVDLVLNTKQYDIKRDPYITDEYERVLTPQRFIGRAAFVFLYLPVSVASNIVSYPLSLVLSPVLLFTDVTNPSAVIDMNKHQMAMQDHTSDLAFPNLELYCNGVKVELDRSVRVKDNLGPKKSEHASEDNYQTLTSINQLQAHNERLEAHSDSPKTNETTAKEEVASMAHKT